MLTKVSFLVKVVALLGTNIESFFDMTSGTERSNLIKEAFALLKSRGLVHTQRDLGKAVNRAEASISKIMKGDESYYTPSFISDLNSAFGGIFNEEYLLGGGGTLLKEQLEDAQSHIVNEVSPVPEENYIMVEYADLRVSAGLLGGGDVAQLPETHRRLLPREYEKGKYLVVRIDGDSMYDGTSRSLVDGDEVLVKEVEGDIREGLPIKNSLFVITTRDGNVVKQILEINRKDEYIVCHSFNPRYNDYKIPFEEILQIFIVRKFVAKQITI